MDATTALPPRAASVHDGQGFCDAMRAMAPRAPTERAQMLATLMARAALAPGALPESTASFCFANAARLRDSAVDLCADKPVSPVRARAPPCAPAPPKAPAAPLFVLAASRASS